MLEQIAAAGYQGIELMQAHESYGPAAHVASRLSAHGLTAAAYATLVPARAGDDAGYEAEMDFAAELGIQTKATPAWTCRPFSPRWSATATRAGWSSNATGPACPRTNRPGSAASTSTVSRARPEARRSTVVARGPHLMDNLRALTEGRCSPSFSGSAGGRWGGR